MWLDREKLYPGENWRTAIRRAIDEGGYFIACFSKAQGRKERSEMNHELNIAIDVLSTCKHDSKFFISVILDEGGAVPDIPINSLSTLKDLHWVNLYEDWEKGIKEIEKTVIDPEKKN